MSKWKTTRRRFLKGAGILGGGLIIGYGYGKYINYSTPYAPIDGALEANSFLQITPENDVIFHMPRSEMGQGVYMGLTTLVAEELDIAPENISVKHVGVHSDFSNPAIAGFQSTGGSTSMTAHFAPLRQMAANIRALLLMAAAEKFGVDATMLSTDNGHIIYQGERHPFGDFVEVASHLTVSEATPLTQAADYKYIGKPRPRNDAAAKATGTALFGIDIDIPDMMRAVVVRAPVIGGTVKSFNADAANSVSGVRQVVPIANGIAVIAKHYHQARKAADMIDVAWDLPPLADYSSADIERDLKAAINEQPGEIAFMSAEEPRAFPEAAQVIEADYYAPPLAHATMEPMNCVVRIDKGVCDIWTGTQAPDFARGAAAWTLGIAERDVHIHSVFLGGGFGRRAYTDFVIEAVEIAQKSGHTIQLVWSREDDMKNDYYRPPSYAKYKATMAENGKIDHFTVTRTGPNTVGYFVDEALDTVLYGFMPRAAADWLSKRGHSLLDGTAVDPSSVEGLFEDYDAAYKEVRHITVDHGLRLGFWRAVGHSFSGFFKECFIDELAHAAGIDPIAFRVKNLPQGSRLKQTLELAAQKANWGTPPRGRFHGVAAHMSFGSYVTEIAEISLEDGDLRVHKVTCAVDCGQVVNPDIVKMQIESGVIYGLAAALSGNITLANGAVEQGNFDDYPVTRIDEAPQIDVHIVPSTAHPTGVGEPGTPPIAAAIGNAIFAASGKRLRRLPFEV